MKIIRDKMQIEKNAMDARKMVIMQSIAIGLCLLYFVFLASMGGPPGMTILFLGLSPLVMGFLLFFWIEHRYWCIVRRL